MENLENAQPEPEPQPQSQSRQEFLKIDSAGIGNLTEIRRWAKFFALLGFIAIALMALMTIVMAAGFSVLGSGSDFAALGGGEAIILVLVMAIFIVLYIFPTLYLWRFSQHAKTAIESRNDLELGESLAYLKKYAKFIGILTIVIMVLYALVIPVMIFSAAATAL